MRRDDLRARAGRWLPALLPFLLAVLLFLPATLGGRELSASDQPLYEAPFVPPPGVSDNPFQADAAYVFEPDALQVRAALRSGRLPVWNSHAAAGTPLLALQQSAPLFPLTWLGVVFPFFGALVWIAVLKLTLAGLGTFLFARGLGLRRSAGLLAGITFAFSSYLVDWLMHPHDNAYLVLPWMLWMADRLVRDGRVRDAGWLGLLTGLAWLGGQPESALLVSLPTAAWIVHRLLEARPERAAAVRRGALAAGAGVLGVALGAAMLIPFLEVLAHTGTTSRSGPPMPLRAVISVIVPDWWGRPEGGQYGGPANFAERTWYVGVLPLLLALAGMVARRPSGPQWFFAAVAVIAAAVSFDTGPIARGAADLPVLDRIALYRAIAIGTFALAMLAAYGLHRLLEAGEAERRRMLIAVAAATAVPVVALVLGTSTGPAGLVDGAKRLLGGDAPATYPLLKATAIVRWGLLGVASVALVLLVRRGRTAAGVAACALVAADLLFLGWGYNPAIERDQAQPARTAALATLQRLTANGGRVVGLGGLEPNTASRWDLSDARIHDPPTLERTSALYAFLGGWTYATPANAPINPTAGKAVDAFGVRAILLATPERRAPEPPVPAPLQDRRVAYQGPDGTVLENPGALPEAFVAYGWRPTSGYEASLRTTVTGSVKAMRDRPAIETSAAAPSGAAPPATPAQSVRRTETSVTIDAVAERPGRLVLLDAFYPGWKATVDGRAVPIAAANTAFRSVPVPAGAHRVRFEYRPASVRWGVVVSLVALVLLALTVALDGRRRRRE